MGKRAVLGIAFAGLVVIGIACGSSHVTNGFNGFDASGVDSGTTFGNPDGSFTGEAGLPTGVTRDPTTCTEAQTSHSYVGCDYWPTVVANGVWSIFDYAVVVSNGGTDPATVTVTGGALTAAKQVTVQPGDLQKIYLPWVPELKGPDENECLDAVGPTASISKPGGAYHLVSSVPVIVYQFNALEYQGVGGEAPDGGAKDWSSCPGSDAGPACTEPGIKAHVGCFSFSNDASLLLPSTALTTNYRITGHSGWTELESDGVTLDQVLGGYFAVTATVDNTTVNVALSAKGQVAAGGGIAAANGGTSFKFTLTNAGDVIEIVAPPGDAYEFSGSLVQSDKPIQVITGIPCINIPEGKVACDHLEQIVPPAETLGKHYVISVPSKPAGGPGEAAIRFYGNEDGTTLTYNPAAPTGCPTSLNAGDAIVCTALVTADFEVTGDKSFGVALFQPGASIYSTTDKRGDPSQTIFPSVEQYRTKYLFLAPSDYETSYADIVGTSDAAPVLDGAPVSAPFTQIGAGPFGTWRVTLSAGQNGAHTLTSGLPVALQVIGYGENTSYQYPGGLNLNLIAPPPPPPK